MGQSWLCLSIGVRKRPSNDVGAGPLAKVHCLAGARRLATGKRCGPYLHPAKVVHKVMRFLVRRTAGERCHLLADRKSVGSGKRGSVRVGLGGRRRSKKKKKKI